MTMPKLTGVEHTALLVTAAAVGSRIVASTSLFWLALVGGILVAAGSFVRRQGWRPSAFTARGE